MDHEFPIEPGSQLDQLARAIETASAHVTDVQHQLQQAHNELATLQCAPATSYNSSVLQQRASWLRTELNRLATEEQRTIDTRVAAQQHYAHTYRLYHQAIHALDRARPGA